MTVNPDNVLDLYARARAVPYTRRAAIVQALPETELHIHLQGLLERKVPGAIVEVTHGPEEKGKDLVLVSDDPLGQRVAAFVVKSGKISGRTVGAVDEIVSQVNQALHHPAKLKNFMRPLEVRQVYVIVAGALSNSARDRISKEVHSVQDIWDLEQVVREFTENYPQVFFDTKLINLLEQKTTELERRHALVYTARDKNLSEWFIEPFVAIAAAELGPVRDDNGRIRHINILTFQKFRELVRGHNQVLLIGRPGSGKSGALAKIALDMMRAAFTETTRSRKSETIPIPILLHAANILQCESTSDLLTSYCGDVSAMTRMRPVALLVDGLDEIQASAREQVLQKAVHFRAELDCPLIVTSRIVDIVASPVEGFIRAELLPFRYGQATRLFERLVSDEPVRRELQEGLQRIQGQLEMTPLSLMLLIEVVREYREVPASLAELYDRFFDQVLGRFDRQKGIEVLFEHTIKRHFLSELAFREFYTRDQAAIPRSDFDAFVSEYASRYSWDETEFGRFVEELKRAAILRVAETVEFHHRSFLSYFVAFHIFRIRETIPSLVKFLKDLYFSDQWSDTLFFYVGMQRELVDTTILDAIFSTERVDVFGNLMKVLCGRLMQAAWLSSLEIKQHGIGKALAYAPALHSQVSSTLGAATSNLPNILADVALINISNISFGSTFLAEAGQRVLNSLIQRRDFGGLLQCILLTAALGDKLPNEQVRQNINQVLGALAAASAAHEVTQEQETRILWHLAALDAQDIQLRKVLLRRLRRILRRNPELSRRIFSPPQKRSALPSGA